LEGGDLRADIFHGYTPLRRSLTGVSHFKVTGEEGNPLEGLGSA